MIILFRYLKLNCGLNLINYIILDNNYRLFEYVGLLRSIFFILSIFALYLDLRLINI